VSDEGTLGAFPRVSDSGRHFSGYSFVAVDKSEQEKAKAWIAALPLAMTANKNQNPSHPFGMTF